MVAQKYRFHGYNSLRFVYTNGKTLRSPQLTLKYVFNPKRQNYRVAVVVAKKVHKSAVVRNRIRRRIYEMIRIELDTTIQPIDFVFSVYQANVADMPARELRELVQKQLRCALRDVISASTSGA